VANIPEARNPSQSEAVSSLLSCGHRKLFVVLPHILEEHWCVPCDMPRTVTVSEEYQVRCKVCVYSRYCGADIEQVFRLALRHFNDRGHDSKYRVGRGKWQEIQSEKVSQDQLDI
jgi:hypothetical protein